MQRIDVSASRRYAVLIENGILNTAGEHCATVVRGNKLLLLTDETVGALYEQTVRTALEKANFCVCTYRIPAGESSKSVDNFLKIIAFLAENGFTRSDALVALGGGVVGDLGGFCAASYLRGIGFVQIPTTLLACVDSSVGGKTAVNLPQGKNLLGAFYQPWLVLCDPTTLHTLSPSVYADGMAEVIKYGMLGDADLFTQLEQENIQTEEIIARCVAIKRDIVQQDERDSGVRGLLNFGHTVGHAVEKCSHFAISHGSAVAIGMVAVTRAVAEPALANRLEALLIKNGLPTRCAFTPDELYAASLSDKKRVTDGIQAVTVKTLGNAKLTQMTLSEWKACIQRGCAL